MEAGKTFFRYAFFPQATWLMLILGLTFFKIFQLWPAEYNYRLFVPLLTITLIVAMLLIFHFETPITPNGKDNRWQLYLAGSLQLAALFWAVLHTGGLDGSPFSFYYLYIPSVVSITFYTPPQDGTKNTIKQFFKNPGIKAATFTAILCLIFVSLHLFVFRDSWRPFTTIVPQDIDTIKSLYTISVPMDTSNVRVLDDICNSINVLIGKDLMFYRWVRFLTFAFPLIMVLFTQLKIEKLSSTNSSK